MKITTRFSLFLIISITSNAAIADIKTDNAVGNCIGLLATKGSEQGMKAALAMADNQNRAMAFADKWLNDLKRRKTEKSLVEGMVYSAASDCRDVGIRSSDY